MQKVYLLLRNNQKTGPYSLDELLQLQLMPFDLVWVEGKSAGWRYPGEIDSLKPYMPDVPKQTTPFEAIPTAAIEKQTHIQVAQANQPQASKKVFVSMPGKQRPAYQPIKEEQAAPRSTASESEYQRSTEPISPYAPGYVAPPKEETQTKYSRPVNDVEEDYTKWIVDNRRKKKSMLSSKIFLAAVLITVVVFGAFYYFKSPTTVVTVPSVAANNQTATTEKDVAATNETGNPDETNQLVVKQSLKKKTAKKIQTTKAVAATAKENYAKKNLPAIPDRVAEKAVMGKQNSDEENVVTKEDGKSKPVAETQTTEKKKKLGEVIKGIFKKKDKNEEKIETVLEDPKPATNRQSQHRPDGDAPGNTTSSGEANVDISDQVDLTSNAPDNWMMGVKGLKITLHNRSSLPIQSAAVNVVYYDENNRILDKRFLSFNKISPKGKLTLSAPDQKWADHVDFKLGDIVLKEDRYAQN